MTRDDAHPAQRHLAEAVQRARRNQGLSRRELAERTGISERFLADIENARANPSLLRLVQLAEVLELSPTELLPALGPGARPDVVALLGLRGAGKSTVGPILAERLGCEFLELDHLVEAQAGLALGELFSLHGEAWFRDAEEAALRELLDSGRQAVLATSGGIVTNRRAWQLLRQRTLTVWLRARPEEHWQRVVAQGDTRPMRNRDRAFAELREILQEREAQYSTAHVTADTSGRGPHQVAASVAESMPAPVISW